MAVHTRAFINAFVMTQSGYHPQNNLAKFGYTLDMKVRNFKNFYILGYRLQLLIKKIRFDFFFLQNKGLISSQRGAIIIGGNLGLLFLKNPFLLMFFTVAA
jgi:hypothetical protein